MVLAGDTMLGRLVAERLAADPSAALFADDLAALVSDADAFVLNLECAISKRGSRWPEPNKRFFFRAPPSAVGVLVGLGVDCVTLANNHALDYGVDALSDTIEHLTDAGIGVVGAGVDEAAARRPHVIERAGVRIGIIGVTDHPGDFAAGVDQPGVAYANLRVGTPQWLLDDVRALGGEADVVLVTPHWGPNMVPAPLPHVRRAATDLREAGATLVAGHSAHVFHGVGDRVLYDLGDFIDDYATDRELRNDLGLLFIVTFDGTVPIQVEAVPITLECGHTRLAEAEERTWIVRRFREACAALGTFTTERDDRIVVEWT